MSSAANTMYLFREGSSTSDDTLWINVKEYKAAETAGQRTSHTLMFFPEKEVAQWFFKDGMAEKSLIEWVRDHMMDPKKNFLDIGAHVGTYTMLCAPKANHTWAFECSPTTFCYLAANVALHSLEEKVSPIPFALGNESNTMKYYVRSKDGGGNGVQKLSASDDNLKTISIPVRTLDSFEIDNVGMIKIDVEGFEKQVLQGALKTLEKSNYPPILFESWGEWKEKDGVPAKQLQNELFRYLWMIGYKIQVIKEARDMYLATKREKE